MKTIKEIKREAKHLFRLCFVDGALDDDRVRSALQGLLQSKRRGSLSVAGQFQRLVTLDRLQHTAAVETALPLSEDLRASVRENLVQAYGPKITTTFAE